jgi:hypothetical protein
MIDVIVPVLSRPGNAQPLIDSIRANTTVEHTITFMCSPGDETEIDACISTDANVYVVEWQPGPADASKKWNLGYRITSNPYVLLAADDLEFEAGWDVEAIKVAERTGAGVIGTQDQSNPLVIRGRHSTHPIVSRDYIDTVGGTWHDGPGSVYHEGYSHQWVETELIAAAMQRHQWAFSHQSVVRHMHPMFPHRGRPRTPMDDTYRIALADGSADSRLFKERQALANPRR